MGSAPRRMRSAQKAANYITARSTPPCNYRQRRNVVVPIPVTNGMSCYSGPACCCWTDDAAKPRRTTPQLAFPQQHVRARQAASAAVTGIRRLGGRVVSLGLDGLLLLLVAGRRSGQSFFFCDATVVDKTCDG